MGLPNWLTALRIVLIPVFVLLMVYRRPGWALGVFAVAALTDALDGWVARSRGLQSRLGAFLDPLADKLLLTAGFLTLTYLRVLPAWVTIVVLSRDLMLVVGALLIHVMGGRLTPRPSLAGKLATFFQVLTVLLGLTVRYLAAPMLLVPAMWVAAAFTIVSGIQYLVQGMRYLHATDAAQGRPSHDADELFRR